MRCQVHNDNITATTVRVPLCRGSRHGNSSSNVTWAAAMPPSIHPSYPSPLPHEVADDAVAEHDAVTGQYIATILGHAQMASGNVGLGLTGEVLPCSFSEVMAQTVSIHAAGSAQAEHHPLIVSFHLGQFFLLKGRLACRDFVNVLLQVGRVAAPHLTIIAMGASPKSQVGRVVPVRGIMVGVVSWQGEVGNFIMLIAGTLQ